MKKILPFFGTRPFLPNRLRVDPDQGIFRECTERVERLVGEDVPVRQEENPGASFGFFTCGHPGPPVSEVPATVKKLPRDLERNGGLPGPGRQRQEDAVLLRGDGIEHLGDGVVLVVAGLPLATLVLEGHLCEPITPEYALCASVLPRRTRSQSSSGVG